MMSLDKLSSEFNLQVVDYRRKLKDEL